jgi:nitrate/TMAO reductase-like tetraheme cytochrome c subunit
MAEAKISPENKMCVACHQNQNRALFMEWERSSHAEQGIGCIDCHGADPSDVDAFRHNGASVSVLVTPKDCSSAGGESGRPAGQ